MRNLILFICLIFSANNSFSQDWNGYTKPELDKGIWDAFKKNKLYVILEHKGENTYEKAFMNLFKKHWSFNEFEFIDTLKKKSLMEQAGSFFFLDLTSIKRDANTYLGKTFNEERWFYIQQYSSGEEKDLRWKSIAWVTYYANSTQPETYMSMFINYLQWYCTLAAKGEIKEKQIMGQYTGITFPDTKAQVEKIKLKPLYILDIYLNKFIGSVEDVKKWYSGEVFVVSENELQNILKTNDDVNIYTCEIETTMARTSKTKSGNFTNETYGSVGVSYSFVNNAKTGELLYKKILQLNAANAPGVLKFMLKEWNK